MRRKSTETVKIPALNYTKLVFCIIELDARDRIFGATPAVNFSRKSAWDTCSAACVAAFGHRRLQQNAPSSLIKLPGNHSSSHAVCYKLPCDFGKLPCGFAGFCATPLDRPHSGCRQISPAAMPRCFRNFFRPPHQTTIGQSRRILAALSSF